MPDLNVIRRDDMPLGLSGLYLSRQKTILIKDMLSHSRTIEVLAEEIGHHFTSSGNITNYKSLANLKQEVKARRFGYELAVSLDCLIKAHQNGVSTLCELTDFLEVSVEFIKKAIDYYKSKYGLEVVHKNYRIRFDPFQIVDIRH